jgi:hypothetical protein
MIDPQSPAPAVLTAEQVEELRNIETAYRQHTMMSHEQYESMMKGLLNMLPALLAQAQRADELAGRVEKLEGELKDIKPFGDGTHVPKPSKCPSCKWCSDIATTVDGGWRCADCKYDSYQEAAEKNKQSLERKFVTMSALLAAAQRAEALESELEDVQGELDSSLEDAGQQYRRAERALADLAAMTARAEEAEQGKGTFVYIDGKPLYDIQIKSQLATAVNRISELETERDALLAKLQEAEKERDTLRGHLHIAGKRADSAEAREGAFRAKLETVEKERDLASKLVAGMHAAAVGSVRGPICGRGG